jgi:hypothetical protein
MQIHNNVFSFNEGGQDFGGGGLWLNGINQSMVVEVFNNTIVHNKVTGSGTYGGKGGGIFIFSIKADTWNNIIWGNTQTSGGPIAKFGGAMDARYSDIQGGYTGTGNFDLDPLFADTVCFSLQKKSPAVDAGDPAINDLTDDGIEPLFPALCGLRSDVGAYGGPWASALPCGVQPITRLFSKITDGALVSTPSDSRSVNFVDVRSNDRRHRLPRRAFRRRYLRRRRQRR